MNYQEACDKLTEYAAGELSIAEKLEIDRLLATNAELRQMLDVTRSLEGMFRHQEWLAPAPQFTAQVMARVAEELETESTRVRIWERTKSWISAAAVLPILALYGKPIFTWAADSLQVAGNRLDAVTGFTLFGLHPVILLGLLAPVIAGGFATCVLTGRCKLSS